MTGDLMDGKRTARPELPALPRNCYWQVSPAGMIFQITIKEKRTVTRPGRWPWSKSVQVEERHLLDFRNVTNRSGTPLTEFELDADAILYSAEKLLAKYDAKESSTHLLGVYPNPLNLGLTAPRTPIPSTMTDLRKP